ncbi:hypothetical protein J1614_005409 [Plenodomus biglobosus]|nr:hypothetical protein J1614_005409 [Plenodomus biglobosus]
MAVRVTSVQARKPPGNRRQTTVQAAKVGIAVSKPPTVPWQQVWRWWRMEDGVAEGFVEWPRDGVS